MKKNRILITGASGFIGRNLTEHLSAKGQQVFQADLPGLDIADEAAVKAAFEEFSPEVVINCANVGGTRASESDKAAADKAFALNLRIFFNLARSLKPGMRMIAMGSGAEYDKRRPLRKVPENSFDAFVPADDYGYAKYLISKYAEKTDNITCLRIFGLYGKYEDCTFKFISNAIVKNILGLPIVINQNVRFDYLWIEDLCEIVGQFINMKNRHPHYNITPTESVDLVSLAEMVNAAGKKKSEIKVLTPGLNREYTGDNTRLISELPDLRFTPYLPAIKKLYAYYGENLEKLDLAAVKADPYLKNCKTA